MEPVFVKACFDVDCEWEGLAPSYRIYVNNELFAERTYVWTEEYLTEMLQIQAPPGDYYIRFEPLDPQLAQFQLSNWHILHGSATWIEPHQLRIHHAGS